MMMVQRPTLDRTLDIEPRPRDELRTTQCTSPMTVRIHPYPTILQPRDRDVQRLEERSWRTSNESTFYKLTHTSQHRGTTPQHSACIYRDTPSPSGANSRHDSLRPSPPSSTTSVNVTVNMAPDPKVIDAPKRPSVLMRLRSSISTSGMSPHSIRRPSVPPSDFSIPPEQPERHFIDSIGMVIPGVCDQNQCPHPLAHFITNWRLCEPIEYTTPLAEHGITYSDYSRLIAALENFLGEISNEPKRKARPVAPWWHPRSWKPPVEGNCSSSEHCHAPAASPQPNPISQPAQQRTMAPRQAAALNKLLAEISWNWQRRNLPVMVCVSSYSLFTPNRISESFVQILHVSPQAPSPAESFTETQFRTIQMSFINPFAIARSGERNVAMLRHNLGKNSVTPPAAQSSTSAHHEHQLHLRDRTKPWPLWPNAIPSRKRELMNGHADRYGVDPYFRAWIRADINSRTRCTSYAKYMIEQEDNPFINTRLEYVTPPRRGALLRNPVTVWSNQEETHYPSTVNRAKYEHNRRLECRKMVEHGSRLRIASFGFRQPIYPPHTPEMEELSLTLKSYQTIIGTIEDIRQYYESNTNDYLLHSLASWRKLGRRSIEDAIAKVSDYIRQINTWDRRVVWTIEKIPDVYDGGLGRDRREWEISIWNGEDPLELLIQLERWGIIEKKLNIDDDE
jgi:hypothetical protein